MRLLAERRRAVIGGSPMAAGSLPEALVSGTESRGVVGAGKGVDVRRGVSVE